MLRVALWFLTGASLLLLAGIVLYTMGNASGHTGWEPFTSLAVFVPAALAGGGMLGFRRSMPEVKRVGAIALAVGLAGIALVVWLDRTNRLVQYERWIRRGMPERGMSAD